MITQQQALEALWAVETWLGDVAPESRKVLRQYIEQGAAPVADVVPTMGAADPLYEKAVAIVRAHKRGSVSLVQRHLAIDYNRAQQMLEAMIGTVIAEMPPTTKLIPAAQHPQQEQSK